MTRTASEDGVRDSPGGTSARDGAGVGAVRDEVDRTPATRAWLRARRGAGRVRRFAYIAYVLVVLLLGWYGLFAIGLSRELGHDRPLERYADAVARLLPTGLVLAALTGFFVTLRDALWRGPVTPPRADVDWLLALPVRRGPVLLPWFALSAGIWTVGALLIAFVGALLVAAAGLGGVGVLTLACLAAALCLAPLAVVGAAVVERSPEAAGRLHRGTPLLLLVLLLVAVQTVAAARGHRLRALETVELWSGPWGWAAQPVLAASGGSAPLWPLALALLVAVTGGALAYAGRVVAGTPAAALRARARASGEVLAGLLAVDLRAARLAMTGGVEVRRRGRVARWAARLSPPRSPALLVAWRDLVALLMAPRRPGLALLMGVLSGAAAAIAAAAEGQGVFMAAAVAALLGHAAASYLLEPARLDADDVGRTAWSPRPYERLALEHAAVPTAVLALGGSLLAAVVRPEAIALVLAAAPVLVAAGLLSAYRSPVPAWILFSGPLLADTGPFLAVFWYAIGPLVGVSGLTLLLTVPLPAAADPFARVAACWTLAALMLMWVRRRALRRIRP
ncbi:hypothetical protein [Streptomyces sp. NPDC088789]|uniref:hypothetical protein n=1 Tax=Streptomyces sp. NPDC088789 TaxID=3365899 RepID=UPI00381A5C55